MRKREFSGNRLGLARMRWSYRKPGSGRGGLPGPAGSGTPTAGHHCAPSRTAQFRKGGRRRPLDHHGGAGAGGGGDAGGDPGTASWLAEPPVGGRHGDLWVLVCGGIAAAAAFGAAFVASGGVASYPATPARRCPPRQSRGRPWRGNARRGESGLPRPLPRPRLSPPARPPSGRDPG